MKFYKPDTNPLVSLKEEEIKAGQMVYNELGQYVKKMYVSDEVYFVEILESVLQEGETMSELTPLQLKLFWSLSRNKLTAYNEYKGKRSRRRIF